ncbi:MAG: hypothetical protein AVDCRST_MAG67-352, partial [uncultured Solirubrobacteraceae bacterium]
DHATQRLHRGRGSGAVRRAHRAALRPHGHRRGPGARPTRGGRARQRGRRRPRRAAGDPLRHRPRPSGARARRRRHLRGGHDLVDDRLPLPRKARRLAGSPHEGREARRPPGVRRLRRDRGRARSRAGARGVQRARL